MTPDSHPEVELIGRFPEWEFFITLTFKGANPPRPVVGRKKAFAYLHQVAKLAGVPFGRLIWVLREERGESTRRLHYHLLIGRTLLPLKSQSCFSLMHRWDRKLRNGFSRVSVFNRSLGAAVALRAAVIMSLS